MMICEPCLTEHYTNFSVFRSWGPCELCNNRGPCGDIPSSDLKPKSSPDPTAYDQHTRDLLMEFHNRLVTLWKTAKQDETTQGYAMRCSMDAAHATRARLAMEEHAALTVQEFNDKVAKDIAALFPEKKEN